MEMEFTRLLKKLGKYFCDDGVSQQFNTFSALNKMCTVGSLSVSINMEYYGNTVSLTTKYEAETLDTREGGDSGSVPNEDVRSDQDEQSEE